MASPVTGTRKARRATLVIGVLVVALVIWLAAEWAAYAYSGSGAPIARRVVAARVASALMPWNPAAVTRSLQVQGEAQLAAGDYNSAVETLALAYRRDVGNQRLLALFKRAQHIQALETVKKAHLQHGHEGPGGTLRPQDIER